MAAGLGLLCAACSTSAAQTTISTSTTLQITTTTVHYVPTYVRVNGKHVLVPVEAHNEPINAYSSEGQNIVIVAKGFEPSKLYAVHTSPIVITNLTGSVKVVVFYHWPNYPRPIRIAPGAHVDIHYGAQISLAYGNGAGTTIGRLYIDTLPGISP
jgi:hypothetical protein